MLIKFTIEEGCIPVFDQARQPQLNSYLADLNAYDPNSEHAARQHIRRYLDANTEVEAKWIACTGVGDQWHPEFEPLYQALLQVAYDPQDAYLEAGKFLGLLLWSEMLNHRLRWHFNKYEKWEHDISVMRYFAWDHICANIKERQAEQAGAHGNVLHATQLEEAAAALRARFRGNR